MVRPFLLLVMLALALPATAGAEPLVLANSFWRVEVEPATLRIRAVPADGTAIEASRGGPAHRVSGLGYSGTRAEWEWDERAWLAVSLTGRDLTLTVFARQPGRLPLIDMPARAVGKGLLLPLAEGRYVPANDPVWYRFMTEELGSINTHQDLSLPLLGMDHGTHTLHWLFLEPFGNRLEWREEGSGLGMRMSHEFSTLAPGVPMRLVLHLGEADPLAGAKRYRHWLIAQGRFEPMEDKLAAVPETHKLLGATHVYLWGGGLLAPRDVTDWSGLRERLRGDGSLALGLRRHLEGESLAVLEATSRIDRYQRRTLVRDLNRALNALAREQWQTASPDPAVMVSSYATLRQLMAGEFASVLAPDPAQWGGGVSRATMQRLQESALPRLWIGLGDSWEPALWHPEAIADGVAAGWLIAPYDSYETALPRGENPDWTTAHLGDDAYARCAIVREGGERKAGFLGKGHYTDPACVRPLLEQRVQAVQGVAGFNSWFLDAYATGMLYESHRPGATMSYAQNALGNMAASRWIAERLGAVVGSEDGNAVTAGGIAFAHGLQTPVMGWDDPDIGHKADRNTASPYYLGNYFPAEQPSVFFKPVPAKPRYQHVHFAAPSRLPLYQAVFHDSLVTSHHWGMDNLKFENVHRETELAQLLYNVAPMYHLSADTLDQRLPAMQRMDAFFRPLHARLATQALVAFRWRSPDRLVQETRFADGTVLLANFSDKARIVDGRRIAGSTVVALTPDGVRSSYTP
ncbi:MAG: glycoside hydrolase [Stenotrophomonas maltophilia]